MDKDCPPGSESICSVSIGLLFVDLWPFFNFGKVGSSGYDVNLPLFLTELIEERLSLLDVRTVVLSEDKGRHQLSN